MTRALSEENRWRAQRYGIGGTYVDVGSKAAKPFCTLLDETIALLADDIDALQLEGTMRHLRRICERGTSAHWQLELYRSMIKSGRRPRQALLDVAKWLRASTEAGDFVALKPPHRATHTKAPPLQPHMNGRALEPAV